MRGDRQREVATHLLRCDRCRRSYEEADRLLEATSLGFLPHLSPDPFLPGRIRATAEDRPRRAEGRAPWYRWALTSAGVAAGIWIGVQLGSGLYQDPVTVSEEEIASAYYQAFSQEEPETEQSGTSSAGDEQWH